MHPTVDAVTRRIQARSAESRGAYLARLAHWAARPRGAQRLGCANVAHAVAALPPADKLRLVAQRAPHLAVVTAYNDMLSAHQPYEAWPALIRDEARRQGATVQVAGGVPAMCDGVTQGEPGMELSLFSRDTIARATAVALSHDVFDGALLLGVCDKIVPGLLIGALHFGHLSALFVPAGPMSTGLSNKEKAQVRERHAQGLASRDELLAAENAAYHGPGTCTFYGTANSNQVLLEAMGLQLPGSSFVHPHDGAREALTREAVRQLLAIAPGQPRHLPIGRLVDEGCIVNAMVALLATGGSTNHLIHWVAVARAAGIVIDWTDFADLSAVVPLLARVYPNGSADVNQFQAAGGPSWVLRELLEAGLLHERPGVHPQGTKAHALRPAPLNQEVSWEPAPRASGDPSVLRPASDPFSSTGGLRLLTGNLGRAVIKVSAVPAERHTVQAPARVFDSQEAVAAAFGRGELDQDGVVVLRFQGPRANGMPELHKLTPLLSVLQDRGHAVALVTDGRMSGASGKVPAAIHLVPEALSGGPLARLRDGDIVRLDAVTGTLEAMVAAAEWESRHPAERPAESARDSAHGLGRELFAGLRQIVSSAEEGAVTW